MINFSLSITISALQSRDRWGTYEERKANSEGYWRLHITLGPFLEGLCEVAKKDGDVDPRFDRRQNRESAGCKWQVADGKVGEYIPRSSNRHARIEAMTQPSL